MTIKRVNHGRGHSYVDTDTGLKIPGVTTITGDGVPKKALIEWSATATIDYAIDHWADLSKKPVSVRAKELKGARYATKDTAANRGTQVHKLAAQLVNGVKVAVPDGLEGYVQSYVRFLDDFDVEPLFVEQTVVSRTHRYCGTLDLIAELLDPDDPEPDPAVRGRLRWLLDVKTNRSGIFGETALQLAGYRYADAIVDDDGTELDMVDVDRTGAVWVRPDGYDLVPVEAGPLQHRHFLYAQQIGEFIASDRDLIGDPIVSPRTSTYRLVAADEPTADERYLAELDERDAAIAERKAAEALF
ncbi:MAG TPA: hypothetical protein VF462_13210 [Micromonosporaceae bacterium]